MRVLIYTKDHLTPFGFENAKGVAPSSDGASFVVVSLNDEVMGMFPIMNTCGVVFPERDTAIAKAKLVV